MLVAGVVSSILSGGGAKAQDEAHRAHLTTVRKRTAEFGIPVPVPPVSVLNEGTRALLEQALQETFATGVWFGDITFGFRGDRLIVWMHRRPIAIRPWGTNPESLQATTNVGAGGLSEAAYLSVIRRLIAEVFQQPPEAVSEAPPVDPRYALQALGFGLLWKLPTVTTQTGYLKINALQMWANVKEAARNLGLTLAAESAPDTSTGRRTIQSVPVVVEDTPLTRLHYVISQWDPMFGGSEYGTGVRVNVTLVVERQRDAASDPILVTRSGPRQQVLVDAIMTAASATTR